MSTHNFRPGDRAVVSDRPQGYFREVNGELEPGLVVTVAYVTKDISEVDVVVPAGWPHAGRRVINASALDPVHLRPLAPDYHPASACPRPFTLSLLNALAALSGLTPEEVARAHGRPDFLTEEN